MRRNRKVSLAIAALLTVAGGGVAIAASGSGSPSEENQAVLDDAAKQLGVSPGKLSEALKKALSDRVDAAVTAGRLTKAEGDALKQRINSDDFPLFGGFRAGFGHSASSVTSRPQPATSASPRRSSARSSRAERASRRSPRPRESR